MHSEDRSRILEMGAIASGDKAAMPHLFKEEKEDYDKRFLLKDPTLLLVVPPLDQGHR